MAENKKTSNDCQKDSDKKTHSLRTDIGRRCVCVARYTYLISTTVWGFRACLLAAFFLSADSNNAHFSAALLPCCTVHFSSLPRCFTVDGICLCGGGSVSVCILSQVRLYNSSSPGNFNNSLVVSLFVARVLFNQLAAALRPKVCRCRYCCPLSCSTATCRLPVGL